LSAYEKAARIDSLRAWRSVWPVPEALGRTEEAAPRFIHARDRDVLRFRADIAMQEIIRATAQTHAGQGVRLLDLEADLQGESQNHMLGDDLLFDYVHLNFRGTFLASRAALRLIREMMPGGLRSRAVGGGAARSVPPAAAVRRSQAVRVGDGDVSS
jgi:hypothetical protein